MRNERAVFARRLRQELVRQNFDTRPVALAKLLAFRGEVSVTQQTISHWLHAKHLPRPEAMHGLSRLLGMDAYSLFREGEPRSIRESRTFWPDQVSGPDRVLFEAFLALPVKERKVVREMIETLVASVARQKRS